METLRFMYRNAKGQPSEPSLVDWVESGKYIDGFNQVKKREQTYLKYRVVEYLDGCESALVEPFVEPPPKLGGEKPIEIVFSGFDRKVKRPALEKVAAEKGMTVRKSVTNNLDYLCYGKNDGRHNKKVSTARSRDGVYLLSETEFYALLDSGVIPDPTVES